MIRRYTLTNRDGRTGTGLLIGMAIYCSTALLMEVVRAHQEVPGGVSYGFEQIEARLAASSPLTSGQRHGRDLYTRYCAVCHGPEGHGDGGNAYRLEVKPRDFASPEFQARMKDAKAVARVIRDGGPSAGMSALMPPWGLTLSDGELDELLTYVQYLSLRPAPTEGAPKGSHG